MEVNWLDDFEARVDRFFANATAEEVDWLWRQADGDFFNTLDTSVVRLPQVEYAAVTRMAVAGHAEDRWPDPIGYGAFASYTLPFEEVALSATSSNSSTLCACA